jgi:hypothetical protein
MIATDKQSLISESVIVTRIDIHPTGEEPDQHAVHVTLGVSRTTTIHKSLLSRNRVSSPGMKSCLPVMSGPTIILG